MLTSKLWQKQVDEILIHELIENVFWSISIKDKLKWHWAWSFLCATKVRRKIFVYGQRKHSESGKLVSMREKSCERRRRESVGGVLERSEKSADFYWVECMVCGKFLTSNFSLASSRSHCAFPQLNNTNENNHKKEKWSNPKNNPITVSNKISCIYVFVIHSAMQQNQK